ncbi:MAG TPA: AbrB/MazE/SpoVT family DNA-binding domain-containing protein [Thermohalobaculum sp.]|nr:AbrB/MazE/SpoVT family DNA-binding domain-containing protein [Thermohalobaculum sp.]
MQHLKVRKIGNSLGVVLPKEVLAQLGVGEGDELIVTNAPGRELHLSAPDADFERQMRAAEEIMDRYRSALAELAK